MEEKDPALSEVMHMKPELSAEDTDSGVIVYINKEKVGDVMYPPKECRRDLTKLAHEMHASANQMYWTCSRLWWWPSMKQDLQAEFKRCQECRENKRSKLQSKKVAPHDLVILQNHV